MSDPAFSVEDGGDARSIIGPGVSLVFLREADRWAHEVDVARAPGGPLATIARSIEWDADRDDPGRVAAPVFQEIRFHADPSGRPVALLLGMSGRHHFSASFAMVEEGGLIRIVVDVADRCREAPSHLASTYTADLDSSDLLACDEAAISWTLGEGGRLGLLGGEGTRLGLAEAGRRAIRVQALARVDPASATSRWHYSWTIAAPPAR